VTVFRSLKEAFVRPLSRKVPIVVLGEADQWGIARHSIGPNSFIVSAGVGHSISFEEAIVASFGAQIILLDPSPTGTATLKAKPVSRNIKFLEKGLAKEPGRVLFGLPDKAAEGSFRKGSEGDSISFECTSLPVLMKENGKAAVDLLKMDIEGFEYEVVDCILENDIDVKQICVEIHHGRMISIDKTVINAAALILKLFHKGYRIIYNKNMDFTFAKASLLSAIE
jgi:FkbM family methyltransferase